MLRLKLLAISLANGVCASLLSGLSSNAQEMFSVSMAWLDDFYDPEVGYLHAVLADAALHHETRSSGWYAAGLLARNEQDDAAQAERIINNIVTSMSKNPADQWFGDYQKEPEEPQVGISAYKPSIYNSWDPNWRSFIGTTLIVILEEFEHLLSAQTVHMVEASLYNASVGDSYRVGGVDDDNFYPSYSNPALMSSFLQGWTGRRMNDSNMTAAGESLAHEIYDLYAINNTLSEFNSATYTGVSLYALTLWSTYMPDDSFLKQKGPSMISAIWNSIGDLWQPDLKNLAGPWDRAYGYDMNRYVSLLAPWIWSLVGREYSSFQNKPYTESHSDDFAYVPLIAILTPYHNQHVPSEVMSSLVKFKGEHIYKSTVFTPPYDYVHRNVTSWLASNISIGAVSFDENQVGGPHDDPTQFNPAVIQWKHDSGIGWITLYSTEQAIQTTVQPGSLRIAYPYSNDSSIFSLLVSTFYSKPTVSSWNDIVGLDVQISGNVNMNYTLSYAGLYGGADKPIHDFEFWNFTYSTVPNTVESWIQLDVQLTG